jgi:hypothetical protein
MNINDNYTSEFGHQLTGYDFEDSNDILSKKECDRIDMFTWNNKSENIRCDIKRKQTQWN